MLNGVPWPDYGSIMVAGVQRRETLEPPSMVKHQKNAWPWGDKPVLGPHENGVCVTGFGWGWVLVLFWAFSMIVAMMIAIAG